MRDHCHITGSYRGSAHHDCDLELRIKPKDIKISVIFHNLRGYDSHFIMQKIGKIAKEHTYTDKKGKEKQMDINVIPNNTEKYMAFILGKHLVFIDSFQFMASSLEKLVTIYQMMLSNIHQEFLKVCNYNMIKQKGVYPYDYMDSFEKFNEKQLPSKDEFYSVLNKEHIKINNINTHRIYGILSN